LDWELKATAVDLREGSEVVSVEPQPDGRFLVAFEEEDGTRESVVADQVGICAATAAFAMAKRLNFSIRFPKLFMALRTILYVDLPESTKKNFTCLKLEDSFGGMLSPLSNECAMIYYPPAAHIMTAVMDPQSCEPPTAYARYLLSGHPETEERASRTLERLREFYPELQRSKILGAYVKVAINTVADSRVRRNVGVFAVCPGAVMTVLPKWTMCVVNARAELSMALRHSVSIGNSKPEESRERLAEAEVACWQSPPTWATNPEAITAEAAKHARNMEVPEVLAHRFGVPEESLSLEPA
jgi:hypothetical protein